MSRPRVLFYVQHLLGVGHLARASRIASALAEDGFDVCIVTGGTPVSGFPPASIRTIALPPVTAGDQSFSGLADADGNPVDEAFKENRRNLLLAALRDVRPDIVILEAFPFGRRQMRFELVPLLESIATLKPGSLVVTSVRDILQERLKPGRAEETVDLIARHFDLVMVHGDPDFASLGETFPLADAISEKIVYTGLVAGPPPSPSTEQFDVVVSAGGGAAGADLLRSAVGAARIFGANRRWCSIAGPNLPQAAFNAMTTAAPPNMRVFRFHEDFASLLTGVALSVSQAGYNTVCDVLRAGCRSLLVPFSAGGETEQATRAQKLEKLGLATVLDEQKLTETSLAAAIESALAKPLPRPATLDLDGARGSARVLRRLLGLRGCL